MIAVEPDQPSSIDRMAARNPDAARILRANLAVYARRSADPEVRSLVADVLAGRRHHGDVLTSPQFNETGGRHLDNLVKGLDDLEPEVREQVLARHGEPTSEAELARMRDDAAPGDGWAAEDAATATDPLFDKYIRQDRPVRDEGGFLR